MIIILKLSLFVSSLFWYDFVSAAPSPMDHDAWTRLNLGKVNTGSSSSTSASGSRPPHHSGAHTSRAPPHRRVQDFGDLMPLQQVHDGSRTSRPSRQPRTSRYSGPATHDDFDCSLYYPSDVQSDFFTGNAWVDGLSAGDDVTPYRDLGSNHYGVVEPHTHGAEDQHYREDSLVHPNSSGTDQFHGLLHESGMNQYLSSMNPYELGQYVNYIQPDSVDLYIGGSSNMISHEGDTAYSMHSSLSNYISLAQVMDALRARAREVPDLNMQLPESSQGVVTRQDVYVPPIEYQLRVKSTQDSFSNDDAHVYGKLDTEQRMVCVEHIRSIRPFSAMTIQSLLGRKMKASFANELLTGDRERIDAAIDEHYPDRTIRKSRAGYDYVSWMALLNNSQRRQVIEELAEASDQSVNLFREHFIEQKYNPMFAVDALNLTTREQRQAFVHQNNLYFETDARNSPWQKGLSELQKDALVQRVSEVGTVGRTHAMFIMRRFTKVPCLGKVLLRADDQTFFNYVLELKSIDRRTKAHKRAAINN
ncbi:hypothetical protein CBS101457_000122 [Exobasidium rhododendri]|nr:hypothetical protein CBS101457_000122 [Exobasidium rhododendri]